MSQQIADLWADYCQIEVAALGDATGALKPMLHILEAHLCAAVSRKGGVVALDRHMSLRVETFHIEGVHSHTWIVAHGDHAAFRHLGHAVAANTIAAGMTSPRHWKRGMALFDLVDAAKRPAK